MAKINYNPQGVSLAIGDLELANRNIDIAKSEISTAVNIIRNARGVSDYISIDYNWILNLPVDCQDLITKQKNEIEQKATQLEAYNKDVDNANIFVRAAATYGMAQIKMAEGVGTAGEQIIDGFASAAGFIAGIFGAKDAQKGIGDWVEKDHVGDFFSDQYTNGALSSINKYSYMSSQGTAANIFKIVGIAGGYVATAFAGGAAAGAIKGTSAGISGAKAAFSGGKAAMNSLKYTAAAAGIGGVGEGTQTGLQSGKSFNNAFKQGAFTGAIQAGSVFAVHYAAKGLGKLKNAKLKKPNAIKNKTPAGTTEIIERTNKASSTFKSATSSSTDDAMKGASKGYSNYNKTTNNSFADDVSGSKFKKSTAPAEPDVTDFIFEGSKITKHGDTLYKVKYRDKKTGKIITDWVKADYVGKDGLASSASLNVKYNPKDIEAAVQKGKGAVVGKGLDVKVNPENVTTPKPNTTNTVDDMVKETTSRTSTNKTSSTSKVSGNVSKSQNEISIINDPKKPNAGSASKVETSKIGPASKIETSKVGPASKVETPKIGPASKVETPKIGPASKVETPKIGPASKVETSKVGPASKVETPKIGPASKVETPKIGPASKVETPKIGPAPKVETPKIGPAPKVETPKIGPSSPEIPKIGERPQVPSLPESPVVPPPKITPKPPIPINPDIPTIPEDPTMPIIDVAKKPIDPIIIPPNDNINPLPPTDNITPTIKPNMPETGLIYPQQTPTPPPSNPNITPTIPVNENITPNTNVSIPTISEILPNNPQVTITPIPPSPTPTPQQPTPSIPNIPPPPATPELPTPSSPTPPNSIQYPNEYTIPNTGYEGNYNSNNYAIPISLGAATIAAGAIAAKNIKEYKDEDNNKKENNKQEEKESL